MLQYTLCTSWSLPRSTAQTCVDLSDMSIVSNLNTRGKRAVCVACRKIACLSFSSKHLEYSGSANEGDLGTNALTTELAGHGDALLTSRPGPGAHDAVSVAGDVERLGHLLAHALAVDVECRGGERRLALDREAGRVVRRAHRRARAQHLYVACHSARRHHVQLHARHWVRHLRLRRGWRLWHNNCGDAGRGEERGADETKSSASHCRELWRLRGDDGVGAFQELGRLAVVGLQEQEQWGAGCGCSVVQDACLYTSLFNIPAVFPKTMGPSSGIPRCLNGIHCIVPGCL